MTPSASSDSLPPPPFSTVDDAFQWIQSFYNGEQSGVYDSRIYRTDRMSALLQAFGNPQRMVPAIHIAGSKGKGSTATYAASILTQCGLKTGLYTSPHLYDYRERITLNGVFFPDALYLQAITEIYRRLPDLMRSDSRLNDPPPTVFELLTLTAFILFALERCQCMVLETGLGGRLDATNTVTPLLSVITRIEKEHTEYLGRHLSQIATEKGGIIKPGRPVLVAPQCGIVFRRLKAIAEARHAPFIPLRSRAAVRPNRSDPYRFRLQLTGSPPLTVTAAAPGRFQGINAACATVAADLFFKALSTLPDAASLPSKPADFTRRAVSALAAAPLHGRMERLPGSPAVYLDGAHTPLSFRHAVKTFTQLEGKRGILVFSAVEGKAHRSFIRSIKGRFARVIVTRAGTFRKNNPEALFAKVRKRIPTAQLIPDTQTAFQTALQLAAAASEAGARPAAGETGKPETEKSTAFKRPRSRPAAVLCAGSFFLLGAIGRPESIAPYSDSVENSVNKV